eukprot:maker-scaffold_34-snap-gene-3.13-mRNA-1 protein AED:0.05 eAED:0.05 QI:0/0.66/0.5/1/0.66/0.5/4/329/158
MVHYCGFMASAICKLIDTAGKSYGVVRINQDNYEANTVFNGDFHNLTPGKHAVAIHVFGDLSECPTSLGLHYNPHGKTHGDPNSEDTHVGNIQVDEKGEATFFYSSEKVKLIGPYSILGRSFVVYEKEDDFGKSGYEMSLVNGNSGEIIGFGVIGITM